MARETRLGGAASTAATGRFHTTVRAVSARAGSATHTTAVPSALSRTVTEQAALTSSGPAEPACQKLTPVKPSAATETPWAVSELASTVSHPGSAARSRVRATVAPGSIWWTYPASAGSVPWSYQRVR